MTPTTLEITNHMASKLKPDGHVYHSHSYLLALKAALSAGIVLWAAKAWRRRQPAGEDPRRQRSKATG